MSSIKFAHLKDRSTSGVWINYVVFNARPKAGTRRENQNLLASLTEKAKASGLRVDQSALCFKEHGRIKFFGDQSLVRFLSRTLVSITWTHDMKI